MSVLVAGSEAAGGCSSAKAGKLRIKMINIK
jgi:hypothetical protein